MPKPEKGVQPAWLKDKGWQKGKSGNPGGRPKQYDDVIKWARSKTVDSLKKIYEIAMQGDELIVALKACTVLLERGWGKVPDKIEISKAQEMSTEELLVYVKSTVQEIEELAQVDETLQ